jgi:hypothetical protein
MGGKRERETAAVMDVVVMLTAIVCWSAWLAA